MSLALLPQRNQEPGRLVLTLDQEKAVEEAAIRYLKSNSLPFDKETFRRVAAIIGVDCLERGILLRGRDHLIGKESVRGLIRTGLEHRRQVEILGKEAVALERLWFPIACDFVGPLAARRDLLQEAGEQLRNFPLTPNVSAVDTLAAEYLARGQILTSWVNEVVASLPVEVYPEASVDLFPGLPEKAKVVRNGITSMAFRGNLSPALSIEEVRQICALDRGKIAQAFSREEILNVFLEPLEGEGLMLAEAGTYLQALIAQTRASFLRLLPQSSNFKTEQDLMAARDSFYKVFSPVLLLNHPALEEKILITSPDKAYPGGYHLWRDDLSVRIGDFRVPTTEGLMRASRLTQAKGYEGDRYNDAITAWRRFVDGQIREEETKKQLSETIARLQEELSRVEGNPEAPIPKSAYHIVYTAEQEARGWVTGTRKRVRWAQEFISRLRLRRERAEDYWQELREKHGDEIPESVPRPRWQLEEAERTLVERRRGVAASFETKFDNTCYELSKNFLLRYLCQKGTLKLDFQHGRLDREAVGSTLIALEGLRADILSGKSNLLSSVDLTLLLDYLKETIRIIEPDVPEEKDKAHKKDREYLADLSRLEARVARGMGEGASCRQLVKLLSVVGLERCILLLEKARYYQVKIPEAQKQYQEALSSPGLAAQDRAVSWPRKEAEFLLREARAGFIPEDLLEEKDLEKKAREISTISASFRSRHCLFPMIIPGEDELEVWVKKETGCKEANVGIAERILAKDAKKIDKKEERVWRYNLRRDKGHIKVLGYFLRSIESNRLWPLAEAKGLPRDRFWQICSARIRLVISLFDLASAGENLEVANREFEQLIRARYLAQLRIKLARDREELDDRERNNRPQNLLLGTMRNLGLLLRI